MNIISRKEAISNGLRRYFTGNACPKGHIAERSISGGCVVCKQLSGKSPRGKAYAAQYQKTPEAISRAKERYNKPEAKAAKKAYCSLPEVVARQAALAKTEGAKAKAKLYERSAKGKANHAKYKKSAKFKVMLARFNSTEEHKAQRLAYARSDRGCALINAESSKRRCAKLQRTPKWSDLGAIKEIYVNRPEGHQVDHIIPLQGKLVSGLHVPENLQYLTTTANQRKSNKFAIE